MTYTCPVCAFDQLHYPPAEYTICPCCGTEFGYSDFATSYGELRLSWLASGAKWHSKRRRPPAGWTPYEQVKRAQALVAAGSIQAGSTMELAGAQFAVLPSASGIPSRPAVGPNRQFLEVPAQAVALDVLAKAA